jgi:hypothetical protein
MTQAAIDVVLGAVVGTVTFCCWWLCKVVGSYAHRRLRWRRLNDQLLLLLHDLVSLHNAVLLTEQRIAELVEGAPGPEVRRFAKRMVELAGALSPLVLAQIRRFGLVAPPPSEPPKAAEPIIDAEHVATADEREQEHDAWGDEP